MKYLLRSAPTLLLVASIVTVAHWAQADVSAKAVVRTMHMHVISPQVPCAEAVTP